VAARAVRWGHGASGTNRARADFLPGRQDVRGGGATTQVVATIANATAWTRWWDPAQRLLYIPAGATASVTVVRQDAADSTPSSPGPPRCGRQDGSGGSGEARRVPFSRSMVRRGRRAAATAGSVRRAARSSGVVLRHQSLSDRDTMVTMPGTAAVGLSTILT